MALTGIVSDIISIAAGSPIPIDQLVRGVRGIASFIKRGRGTTRARTRKAMMAKRRRFVDTVVLAHERRLQKINLENRVNQTKDLLRKLEKDHEEASLARMARKSARGKNNRYGNYDTDYDDENAIPEESHEHLNTVQSIISNQEKSANQNWKDKTDKKNKPSREM